MIPVNPSRLIPRDISMQPYPELETPKPSELPRVKPVYCTPVENKNTYEAPHRIVHLQNLQDTVDSHLQPCMKCHSKGQRLRQTKATNFAITLEIVCDNCVSIYTNLHNQIRYLEEKMSKLNLDSHTDQKGGGNEKTDIK